MSMSDTLGDMLTRIRNGLHAHRRTVACRYSRHKADVCEVLKNEGYIRGYAQKDRDLEIELKYMDGEAVIKEMRRISKPGRRVYRQSNNLPRVHNGLGIAVVSTPKGVMSDFQARENNVGGEVLAEVF